MFVQLISADYPRGTFFTAPHSAIRDSSISFAARGLLMYLISRGDGWRLTAWEMKAQGMGRTAFDSVVRELEQAGYLEREQQRDPRTGQWLPASWQLTMKRVVPVVVENPHTENPHTANPNAADPNAENVQDSVNQESVNQESVNQVSENQSSESAHAPDDDSSFSLPVEFGKLSESQRADLEAEVKRLGVERVRAVIERVKEKRGVKRPAAYLLTALKNESESTGTDTLPSSASPSLYLLGKYADFIDFGNEGWMWQMPTPSPDVREIVSQSGDTLCTDDNPPQYSQREADFFDVAMDQLKHQLGRATFECYVMGTKLIRSENDGKRLVLQAKTPYAAEMMQTRLYRHMQRTLRDCINLQCPIEEFEVVLESAPVKKLSLPMLVGVGS